MFLKIPKPKTQAPPLFFIFPQLLPSAVPTPQPWPVSPSAWATGIASHLVSLPGVSLSKPSSVPQRQSVLNCTRHSFSKAQNALCVLFYPQHGTKLLGLVFLAFIGDCPKGAPTFPFRIFLSNLPIHTEWFAFHPLLSRPRGFPPPALGLSSLWPPLLFSEALWTSPNYLGRRWSLSSDVHWTISPPQWHLMKGVLYFHRFWALIWT